MDRRLKQKPINIVKVVLFGPESTGKATLASQLAYIIFEQFGRQNLHVIICRKNGIISVKYVNTKTYYQLLLAK